MAVEITEISYKRLKAKSVVGSRKRFSRGVDTAKKTVMAVEITEISHKRLKARSVVGSRKRFSRGVDTA